MKYITACPAGKCYLDPGETIHKRHKTAKGTETKRHVCIHHGGLVIARQAMCEECGVEFEAYKSGALPERCPVCQKKFNRATVKRHNRERYLPKDKKSCGKKNGHLADIYKRSTCVDISKCLDEWDGYDAIPCKPCKKHVIEDMPRCRVSPKIDSRQYGSTGLNSAFL